MPTRFTLRFPLLIACSGLALSVSVTTTCARVSSAVERVFPGDAGRLARSVTIYRDEWGVPHIYGPTDASVVFGMAYAQAEDNFWQIEEDFIQSLGRSAQLYGEASLPSDLVRAAFEVERLSREEYAREPRERQRLWDAFALGLNHYLAKHPEVRPRLLTRFEPWFVFVRFRPATAGTIIDGVRLGDVVAMPIDSATGAGDWQEVGVWDPVERLSTGEDRAPHGSNMWAVAPARTEAGHALLFQNPHVAFFGSGQRYEVHLQSDEGWHFSGFAILGTPVPRAGHNEHLGWSHTNSAADVEDAYELTLDDPADPLAYRHGEGWRRATEWEDTLLVNTANGMERRRFRFRKTHHGPIVARRDGKPVAVRIARFEEGGSLQQWYAMGKARTLEEFTAALGQTALPISNTMYADQQGNIFYVHGNAVPRRSPSFDWTRPLDGADLATEWQGYHTLEELPRLLNPASAWLQNTNSTPFLATAEGHNLSRDRFPAYMAPEADNARAAMSRRILQSDSAWTFDEWAAAAFDTRVFEADTRIPGLVDAWERLGATDPDRAAKLDSAINELREWDHVSTITSSPMTLFMLWLERMRRPGSDTAAYASIAALEETVTELQQHWGTWRVSWGDVNRLQRVHTGGQQAFDDAMPSLPVPGAPDWAGIIFNFTTRPGPDGKHRYGTSGHTWVSVAEFGPRVRARSIVPFGQSADSTSAHYFDQAPLYAQGRLKEAWFWREDVERNARRAYRPGQPDLRPATGGAR